MKVFEGFVDCWQQMIDVFFCFVGDVDFEWMVEDFVEMFLGFVELFFCFFVEQVLFVDGDDDCMVEFLDCVGDGEIVVCGVDVCIDDQYGELCFFDLMLGYYDGEFFGFVVDLIMFVDVCGIDEQQIFIVFMYDWCIDWVLGCVGYW